MAAAGRFGTTRRWRRRCIRRRHPSRVPPPEPDWARVAGNWRATSTGTMSSATPPSGTPSSTGCSTTPTALPSRAVPLRRLYDSTKETPTTPSPTSSIHVQPASRSPLNPGRFGAGQVDSLARTRWTTSSEYAEGGADWRQRRFRRLSAPETPHPAAAALVATTHGPRFRSRVPRRRRCELFHRTPSLGATTPPDGGWAEAGGRLRESFRRATHDMLLWNRETPGRPSTQRAPTDDSNQLA